MIVMKTLDILKSSISRAVLSTALAAGMACGIAGPDAVQRTLARAVARGVGRLSDATAGCRLRYQARAEHQARRRYEAALASRQEWAEQLDMLRAARSEVARRLGSERATLRTIQEILVSQQGE